MLRLYHILTPRQLKVHWLAANLQHGILRLPLCLISLGTKELETPWRWDKILQLRSGTTKNATRAGRNRNIIDMSKFHLPLRTM